MNVVAADWQPYALPLKRPWQTSRGSCSERHGRLLRLTSADGRQGWGDCAPLPEFGIDDSKAAAFAEESALLDLAAQRAGLPLNAWLSGEAAVPTLAVNAVLGDIFSLSPADFTGCFSVFKLKVGGAVQAEISRLQQLCRALPASVRLRLDANAAWDFADARKFLAACAELPVEAVEEPLRAPDLASLYQLQRSLPFPLAIDESTQLLDAAFFANPPVRRLVIKPPRQGGLLASAELALRARRAGLECIVTASLESTCGLLACAHLAAAVAPEAVHGLATADWFADNTAPPPVILNGRLQLPLAPGLGF